MVRPVRFIVLWSAVLLHLLWGVLILVSAAGTMRTSGISHLIFIAGYLGLGETALAWFLISIALLAAFAILLRNKNLLSYVTLIALQQAVIMLSAAGGIEGALLGQFANGYVPPNAHLFILADQMPSILVAVVHTVAVWAAVKEWQL